MYVREIVITLQYCVERGIQLNGVHFHGFRRIPVEIHLII